MPFDPCQAQEWASDTRLGGRETGNVILLPTSDGREIPGAPGGRVLGQAPTEPAANAQRPDWLPVGAARHLALALMRLHSHQKGIRRSLGPRDYDSTSAVSFNAVRGSCAPLASFLAGQPQKVPLANPCAAKNSTAYSTQYQRHIVTAFPATFLGITLVPFGPSSADFRCMALQHLDNPQHTRWQRFVPSMFHVAFCVH